MEVIRASTVIVMVLGILASGACDRPGRPGFPAQSLPPVSPNEPGPDDPPVIWIAGTLEAVEGGFLTIREGAEANGPRIRLERLAEGATSFYRLAGHAWQELPEDDAELVDVGERVCVEALLDGQTFLALRVFLGSSCAPGPVG
jgi:hypothetical protein